MQKEKETYYSETFAQEKFILASKKNQLQATINRYYKKEAILYLFHIDTLRLQSELKYEWSPKVQEDFPHIYGGINKEAIMRIEKLTKDAYTEDWKL